MFAHKGQDFLLGALVGCAVGAIAGLLLTPLPGQKIRNKIFNGFDFYSHSPNSSRQHKPVRKRSAKSRNSVKTLKPSV